MRLVIAINDHRLTIDRDGRRPMVRSIDRCILRPIVRAIVSTCNRSYAWHNVTERRVNRGTRRPMVRSIVGGGAIDRTINRSIVRPIVRSIVATYDRSYDQSWHQFNLESQVSSSKFILSNMYKSILKKKNNTLQTF